MPQVEIERNPLICVAEDRASCEPGIRILLASIAQHSPHLPVELFYPKANPRFSRWVAKFPNVALNRHELEGPWNGFNIKPRALLTLFESGADDVLWIDTDIVVTANIQGIYKGLSLNQLIVAEEAMCSSHYDGDAMRARSWGLPVGRRLPFQLNSGVVGFTRQHLGLLRTWRNTLDSDEYRAAYKLPWNRRPRHFMGDQEVLTALLCSTQFAEIPLRLLRRGGDIIQYFDLNGYTLRERAINLVRKPTFIHSLGHKPWFPPPRGFGIRGYLWSLYEDVSPYRCAARIYAGELSDRRWLAPSTVFGRLSSAVAAGRPELAGLPLAAAFDVIRHIKWIKTGGEPRRAPTGKT